MLPRTGGTKADCGKRPNRQQNPLRQGRMVMGRQSVYYNHTTRTGRQTRVYCDPEPTQLRNSIASWRTRYNRVEREKNVELSSLRRQMSAERKALEEQLRSTETQRAEEAKKWVSYKQRIIETVPNLAEMNRQEDQYLSDQSLGREFYIKHKMGAAAFTRLFRTRARILVHIGHLSQLADGTLLDTFATLPTAAALLIRSLVIVIERSWRCHVDHHVPETRRSTCSRDYGTASSSIGRRSIAQFSPVTQHRSYWGCCPTT